MPTPMEQRSIYSSLEKPFEILYYSYKRIWECAERKTRKSSGVDGTIKAIRVLLFNTPRPYYSAVAVLAILQSKTNAFPLSTVVIEQYRPPIDKFIIGVYSVQLSDRPL